MPILTDTPFGVDVTVVFHTPNGQTSDDGRKLFDTVEKTYRKCVAYDYDANAITTNEITGSSDQVIVGKMVVLSEQVDVSFIDTVKIGDKHYRVYGQPMNNSSAMTGDYSGTQIACQLVEG